jgi:RHS repeat-associated protein
MVFHQTEQAGNDRRLCWDEQNRLLGVKDNRYLSLYQYDANGERTYKLTGKGDLQNISGEWQRFYMLDNATLYASPYLVATSRGYTKHYYAGSERICSKIGGGGLAELDKGDESDFSESHRNAAVELFESVMDCLEASAQPELDLLFVLYDWRDSVQPESDCYWYHPDHLGSSSWITDSAGAAVQHLHYLPWGEDFVNQRLNSFDGVRYTFSAKEKDSETGLNYFGSRYYSSDLSIWLSVDPMAAKYPSLSPYVYCADNPVRLVDPNGKEVDDNLDKWKYNKDTKKLTWVSDAGGKYHQTVVETVNTSSGEKVNRTIDYDGAIGQLFDFSVISKKWDGIINGTLDVYSGYQTAKAGVMIMSEGSVVTNGAAFPVGAIVFSAGAYQTVDGLMTISNAIAGRGVDMYEQQDMVRDICKSAGNSIVSLLSTSKNPKIQDVVKSIGRSIGALIISATWARLVRKATTHPTYNKALPAGAVVH